jgi:hypothetical protein
MNRIKNIQNKLGKDEYTEDRSKEIFLMLQMHGPLLKLKKQKKCLDQNLKQVQGPTTQQRLFERILEEGGLFRVYS